MKPILLLACIAGFSVWPAVSSGQPLCHITVESNVEVAGGEFSLADLLAQGSCSSLRRAAAGVRMGSAPLAGSVRVIEGSEIRTLLNRVAATLEPETRGLSEMRIPERVTVRRAGTRASCADIGARILASPSRGSETRSRESFLSAICAAALPDAFPEMLRSN